MWWCCKCSKGRCFDGATFPMMHCHCRKSAHSLTFNWEGYGCQIIARDVSVSKFVSNDLGFYFNALLELITILSSYYNSSEMYSDQPVMFPMQCSRRYPRFTKGFAVYWTMKCRMGGDVPRLLRIVDTKTQLWSLSGTRFSLNARSLISFLRLWNMMDYGTSSFPFVNCRTLSWLSLADMMGGKDKFKHCVCQIYLLMESGLEMSTSRNLPHFWLRSLSIDSQHQKIFLSLPYLLDSYPTQLSFCCSPSHPISKLATQAITYSVSLVHKKRLKCAILRDRIESGPQEDLDIQSSAKRIEDWRVHGICLWCWG